MNPNPILRRLGLADADRAVIIHADDVGMCQASVAAYAELADLGAVSSASVMVPCPWFLEAAACCRARPQADVGVHLTLTSEWQTYRWGPISTRDPASGLLDAEGCFHRDSASVQARARAEAVQAELCAQVERARAAGIDVTHVDTHMGTVLHPKFIEGYLRLALERRVVPMVLRLDEAGARARGLDAVTAAMLAREVADLEAQGVPLIDHIAGLPLDRPARRLDQVRKILRSLPPGVTHLIFHPALDTPELRAIAPDAAGRVADYQALASPELWRFLAGSGLHVIGYRALRDLLPTPG